MPLLTSSTKPSGRDKLRPMAVYPRMLAETVRGSPSITPRNALTTFLLRRRAAHAVFLPIVKVVVLIFTVTAVSVVLYIFFLRHRCCLILIRHLQPGSEEPPRATDCFKVPRCYWLRAPRCLLLPARGELALMGSVDFFAIVVYDFF